MTDEAQRDQADFDSRVLASEHADELVGWGALARALIPLYSREVWPTLKVSSVAISQVQSAFTASLARLQELHWLPDRVWDEARRFERVAADA